MPSNFEWYFKINVFKHGQKEKNILIGICIIEKDFFFK